MSVIRTMKRLLGPGAVSGVPEKHRKPDDIDFPVWYPSQYGFMFRVGGFGPGPFGPPGSGFGPGPSGFGPGPGGFGPSGFGPGGFGGAGPPGGFG